MQSNAKTVTEYLAEVPAERRAALTQLRALCRGTLTDFEESTRYGGPCCSRAGEIEISFASQKHFIGLYILRTDVMDAHRDLLQARGVSLGKGCIRFSRPERIDFKVVEMMLRATQESIGPICD